MQYHNAINYIYHFKYEKCVYWSIYFYYYFKIYLYLFFWFYLCIKKILL